MGICSFSFNYDYWCNSGKCIVAVINYISNDSFIGNQSLQNVEKCYPLQKNIWLRLTNEQVCYESPLYTNREFSMLMRYFVVNLAYVSMVNINHLCHYFIQISPGTWYFGLFNGIGPVRTQSKMVLSA